MNQTSAQPPIAEWPAEMGGYRLTQELIAGHSYRAIAPGERSVVIKLLESDLIVRGQLHPHVRDRLSRVREIAHLGVVNLYGAERDAGHAYTVWEYIPGQSLAEWCEQANRSPRELLLIARELVLAVESLHARGIVHGAIHSKNVIVDSNGRVRLTHISPYLYTDPQVDTDAVVATIQEMVAGAATPLAVGILPAPEQSLESLRSLGTRITAQLEMRQQSAPQQAEVRVEKRQRNRSLIGAMGVLLAGMLGAMVLHRTMGMTSMALPLPPESPRGMAMR